MNKKPLFLSCSAIVVLVSAPVIGNADTRANVSQTMTVEPGKMHEECMKLDAGDKLSYEFESGTDLIFNVHYHVGEEIIFPVEDHKTSAESSALEIEIEQDYCLMWTNRSPEDSDLHYEVKVR